MAKMKIKAKKELKRVLMVFQEEDSIGYDYLNYLSKKEIDKLIKDLIKAREEVWQKHTQ
jgi:hypothetical protein